MSNPPDESGIFHQLLSKHTELYPQKSFKLFLIIPLMGSHDPHRAGTSLGSHDQQLCLGASLAMRYFHQKDPESSLTKAKQ